MGEQKESPMDKGCIFGVVLSAIFFLLPIISWWWPVAIKLLDLIKRFVGVDQ